MATKMEDSKENDNGNGSQTTPPSSKGPAAKAASALRTPSPDSDCKNYETPRSSIKRKHIYNSRGEKQLKIRKTLFAPSLEEALSASAREHEEFLRTTPKETQSADKVTKSILKTNDQKDNSKLKRRLSFQNDTKNATYIYDYNVAESLHVGPLDKSIIKRIQCPGGPEERKRRFINRCIKVRKAEQEVLREGQMMLRSPKLKARNMQRMNLANRELREVSSVKNSYPESRLNEMIATPLLNVEAHEAMEPVKVFTGPLQPCRYSPRARELNRINRINQISRENRLNQSNAGGGVIQSVVRTLANGISGANTILRGIFLNEPDHPDAIN